MVNSDKDCKLARVTAVVWKSSVQNVALTSLDIKMESIMKKRTGTSSVKRTQTIAALIFVATMAMASHAIAYQIDRQQLNALSERLEQQEEIAVNDYLNGDADEALRRLSDVVDEKDWKSLFVLGNMVWRMHPDQSYQWHTRAYELSQHDGHVLLELAFHYTRMGECSKAIEAWKQVEKAKLMGPYMPMLAGYCYLKIGDDKQAFGMFDRAELGKHAQFEEALDSLWGRPSELVVHAEHLRALRGTAGAASLDAALDNVAYFDVGRERGRALLAIAGAARPHAKNLGATSTQLDCLRPAFEQEMNQPSKRKTSGSNIDTSRWLAEEQARKDYDEAVRAAWKRALDSCKLLISGHPLPENPVFARLLVVNALNMGIASRQELLAVHRKTLNERARSQVGDIEALRILASLQESESDPGLEETNDLGWSRYGDPKFAASRVRNQLFKSGATSPEDLEMLNLAYQQFPDDQMILDMWLRYGSPSADEARKGWRKLLLMEFQKPSLQRDEMHFRLLATKLYKAIQEYRKVAGL